METNTSTETTTPAKPARVPTKRPAKTASAKPVKKAAAKQKTAAPVAGSGTPLKTLAAKLGMETKLARRKLRAAKFDWHGHRERWTFNAKQLEKAREILAS